MRRILSIFGFCAAVAMAAPVVAAPINAPLPTNAYITKGGLDWAWASPVPADGGAFGASFAVDLSFQGLLGWRLPTLAELANAPTVLDFLFPGANVPLNGTDPVSGANFNAGNSLLTGSAACATPYFHALFTHCDWGDGRGASSYDWADGPGSGVDDQLLVRVASVGPSPVPLPGSVGLMAAALAGLGLARSRRKA